MDEISGSGLWSILLLFFVAIPLGALWFFNGHFEKKRAFYAGMPQQDAGPCLWKGAGRMARLRFFLLNLLLSLVVGVLGAGLRQR
ncbi:MAG: hypothetical protein HUK26_04015, partial [Duodenibacillus sp.]|nr:hypothetical protein [Duodenibacillus sp.]